MFFLVLKNMLLITHRQAWCWQDEYVDLSINDVRLLEAETQEILNEKMSEHNNNSKNKDSRAMKKSNSKSSISTINSKCSKEKCKNFRNL